MTPAEQAHLRILRIVEEAPQISQRQLAERLGVSLGKANYLLKALLDQGYIKAGNFLRAEDKLKYAYLLTPEFDPYDLDIILKEKIRKTDNV